jgi:hypothetical protein
MASAKRFVNSIFKCDIETGNNMIVYLDREDYKEIGQTIVETSSKYPYI